MGTPDVTDSDLPQEFQQRVEDYIHGRLTEPEEEEFWTEVISDGDKMDYFHMCWMLKHHKDKGGEF